MYKSKNMEISENFYQDFQKNPRQMSEDFIVTITGGKLVRSAKSEDCVGGYAVTVKFSEWEYESYDVWTCRKDDENGRPTDQGMVTWEKY